MALHPLERRLYAQAIARRLFPRPGLAVVAVSGGPDSVALVHALHTLGRRLGIELLIGHLDHGLRGAEAVADAAAVGELAGRLGLPAEIGYRPVAGAGGGKAGTGGKAGPGGPGAGGRGAARVGNLEERARVARYAFLGELTARHGASYLAVGHTRDDQAETLLMRLVRGAGPRGLTAMTPLTSRPGVAVVRPLLDLSRDLVRRYLADLGLPYHLDHTNRDLNRQRNRVRHVLLPLLQAEFNPNVVKTLGRTATLMDEVDRYLAARAREVLPEVLSPALAAGETHAAEPLTLDLRHLAAHPRVLRRYLLRAAVERLRGDLRGISFAHVEALLELAEAGRGGRRRNFPGGIVALREGRTLTLWSSEPTLAITLPETTIELPGSPEAGPWEVVWPELGVGIRTRLVKAPQPGADPSVSAPEDRAGGAPGGENPGRAVFDRAQLVPPLRVRSRREGDRIQLPGRPSPRKVKDLLIAVGVPRRLRPGVPLLVDGAGGLERVLWVAGVARSAHAPVGAGAMELVEVELFIWTPTPPDRA